jgi:hypothetical protein
VFDVIKHEALSISITYDLWTSRASESYIGVTAHWCDETPQLRHACVLVKRLIGSHTGQAIAAAIECALTSCGKPVDAQILGMY